MKKTMILGCLLISGCMTAKPMPTIEQYCGQTLGLKYGTKEYAQCGMNYSEMRIQAAQVDATSRNQRYAIWQSSINASRPTNLYIHPGY